MNIMLGVFLTRTKFPHKAVREIVETFDAQKVFVFQIDNEEKYLLTFNLDKEVLDITLERFQEKYSNTIRLHRKRNYNILYTINALIALEKANENNIDWKHFENSCLVLNKENELSKLGLNLKRIVKYTGEKK